MSTGAQHSTRSERRSGAAPWRTFRHRRITKAGRFPNLPVVALTIGLLLAPRVSAEIVFVPLDDVPIMGDLMLTNGPFNAAFLHGPPCEELPPGIGGPPCIVVYCGLFGDTGSGMGVRLTAGEPIGSGYRYSPETILAGFEVINPSDPPESWQWRPLITPWHDASGAPTTGYLPWGGMDSAGNKHYGWVELTVEYDPAIPDHRAYISGFAYETEPGKPIIAGDTGKPCPGDLDWDGDVDLSDLGVLLANYGKSGASYEEGDVDGDGDVDLSDLGVVLAAYGEDCD